MIITEDDYMSEHQRKLTIKKTTQTATKEIKNYKTAKKSAKSCIK